jgi:hypothetical protein
MSTLFVFYNINPATKNNTWSYKRFPKGWTWVGAGSAQLTVGGRTSYYMQEEQFGGPKEGKAKMRDVLDRFFRKLVDDGVVTKYKIRQSYLP